MAPPPARDLRIAVPHLFRCPISLELLRDPVTLSTGQTYERSSIQKWLSDGNRTCPVTMQRLDDLSVTPNHTLRRLIQDWCCLPDGSRGAEPIPTPKQQEIARLKQNLSSADRSPRLDSLRILKSLSKESTKARMIVESGVLPLVASHVFKNYSPAGPEFEPPAAAGSSIPTAGPEFDPPRDHRTAGSSVLASGPGFESWKIDYEVVEEALGVLAQLVPRAPGADEARLGLSGPRRLSFLGFLLQHGSMEARISAGSLVEALCGGESPEVRERVGGTAGVAGGLVWLLRQGHYPRAVRAGTRATFALCLSAGNWERAVGAGAAEALVESLVDADGAADVGRALATVELLCKTEAGQDALGRHALGVPVLVKMMLRVPRQASESATAALLAVCRRSEGVRREAVEAGVLARLLLVLQSEGTARAKSKARALLKLLSPVWGHDPCTQVFDL